MEFPFVTLIEMNSSKASADLDRSLYGRKPAVAALYVAVLGVAAVVGTFGNLLVITAVTAKYFHSMRHLVEATGNDVGLAFIANLAFSDLIVTAVINPFAIAGLCALWATVTTRRLYTIDLY